jgi:hypothetical protein
MGERKVVSWLVVLSVGLALTGQRLVFADSAVAEKLAAGVWRSIIVGGTNLYDFPLTPLGQRRFETFQLDQDPSLRCEPPGMPRAFYHLSPMDFSFDAGEATIRYETMDVVRTIHMDGTALPENAALTPNGYSIGRWDGDLLVVDTAHLAEGETVREGVPKSAAMTLRETFGVEDRDDGLYLTVTMTITDPENFSVPFTSINEFILEPDWELLPFNCQPTEY